MGQSRFRRRSKAALVLTALVLAIPAEASTEKLDYVRKDVQRHGPDDFVWGGLARNRDELRVLWDRYNQTGKLPTIRFQKNVAVLGGTGGSSSCPARLHDLRLNRERKRIVMRVYQTDPGPGFACTDDWVPKTFTLAVSRDDLKPLRASQLRVRPRRIQDPDPG
ncbi:MAG TPA: hypothetical protein VHJ82_00250 [Actinomycetota bacterium]|nr:hypothetical protein [Actinomycetota bacterium]